MRCRNKLGLISSIIWLCLGHTAQCSPPANKALPMPSQDAIAAMAPEHLSSAGLTLEQYAFKQEVYHLHVQRGEQSGRMRIYDLPPSELTTIPGTDIQMRRDAAAALGKLLKAANRDLVHDRKELGKTPEEIDCHIRALLVESLGLSNAYRSASTQFSIWDRNFQRYLSATEDQRNALPGGKYGPQAAAQLRDYIGVRVAAPGFSNHQGGIAVDFTVSVKPNMPESSVAQELSASTAQIKAWQESWFWLWLNRRAKEFGFRAYLPEPWHWEYIPGQGGKSRN